MKTDKLALSNANIRRGGTRPSYVGFTSNVLPEVVNVQTGVSVRYVQDSTKQWFVLRVSYNRWVKAKEILDKDGIDYYIPMHSVVKLVDNRKKRVLEPLLPNFFFIYAKEEYTKSLINSPQNTVLSYYYNHFILNEYGKNPPLTISYKDMMNFINATSIDNKHILVVNPKHCHYKSGDMIRIIDGDFKGVEGRVARIAGQQRVVVEIKGLCLIATAYIPTAFLSVIREE